MTNSAFGARPVPKWFGVAAILSVLWMLLGCGMYLFEVTLDPATLPTDSRAMVEAIPVWMWAAFATAVWVGLAGAVLLLMRRRLAVPLLGISVLAMLVQNSAYLVDPRLREAVPPASLALPVIDIAITVAVFLFARQAQRKGWLR